MLPMIFTIAVLAAFACGVIASKIGEKPACATTESSIDLPTAQRILYKTIPTPTPLTTVMVTTAGNVAFPGLAIGAAIKGMSPAGSLPTRCRSDFATLPDKTTLVCLPDDALYKLVTGR